MGATSTYIARTFYSALAFNYQVGQRWHLARAADEEDIFVATPTQDPISLALEHEDLAHAAIMAEDSGAAQEHIKLAEKLLASVPATDVTEKYRVTMESYSALVDGLTGKPEQGLARLEQVRPQADQLTNVAAVSDFHRIAGELQSLAGRQQSARIEFEQAAALGETMRASLRAEPERIAWMRQWANSYLNLVEADLRLGESSEALSVWELYRDLDRDWTDELPKSVSTSPKIEDALARFRALVEREGERFSQHFSPLRNPSCARSWTGSSWGCNVVGWPRWPKFEVD